LGGTGGKVLLGNRPKGKGVRGDSFKDRGDASRISRKREMWKKKEKGSSKENLSKKRRERY